jgi:hypothetical protein
VIKVDNKLVKFYSFVQHDVLETVLNGEVAEISQIFLRDTHVLPKLVSYEEHCRRDRW